jgi:hypothetical protein
MCRGTDGSAVTQLDRVRHRSVSEQPIRPLTRLEAGLNLDPIYSKRQTDVLLRLGRRRKAPDATDERGTTDRGSVG